MKELALLLCMAVSVINTNTPSLTLTSPAFKNNGSIPQKYTCEGEGINPPLKVTNIPKSAKTLALIVDDPDADKGTFDHWVMWNMPVQEMIAENSKPGVQGNNGKDLSEYAGPCPPTGTHHYHFKLYALDGELNLAEGATKKDVEKAMEGHIVAKTELIGLYQKKK